MMGHTISTYHDIRMKGIEYLRGVYISSGLSIKPKTRLNKLEALKEMIRAWGLNPDQVMSREALAQSNTTVIDRAQLEQTQLTQLTAVLKQQMIKEICESQGQKSMNSRLGQSTRERPMHMLTYTIFFEPPNFIILFRFLAPGRKLVFLLSSVENRWHRHVG